MQPRRLDFPSVTVGDTVQAVMVLVNRGDAMLTVSAIDASPRLHLSPSPPFAIEPDSSVEIVVELAPRDPSDPVALAVHSNDPANPVMDEEVAAEILPLAIESNALTAPGPYPLGEALVIQSIPMDRVHVETATVFFRSGVLRNFQPQRMFWNGRAFIAIIPGSFVQEGGLEFYVTAENSGITVNDPPTGPGRPFRVDVDSPHNYELSAVIRNPGSIWNAGEKIDFILALSSGTVFQSGVLHYRRGGDSLYQDTPILEVSFTGIAASIPSSWVGERGVEYWSEIQTLTRRIIDPAEDPKANPHQLRITVANVAEPGTTPAGRYRMLSIPLNMQNAAGLSAILSEEPEFGSYDPVRWRAFRYSPELDANVEFSPDQAALFTLMPGRAFWLISRDAHSVDSAPVPGVSTQVDTVRLVLAPGWNQIANPFAFPVEWSRVRRSSAVGDPIAYDPARADYADATPRTLEPFQGYFVQNGSTEPETIAIPPILADSASLRSVTPESVAPVASLRVEARTARGSDLANRIGVADDAGVERDARDQPKPPAAPDATVRLGLANHAWRNDAGLYRRDFRPARTEGNTWEIEITSASAGEAVELALRPEHSLPPGTSIRLIDREQRSAIGLDPNAPAWRQTVLSFGPERAYRLVVVIGSEGFVEGTPGIEIPRRLQLDPVAPNPTRGAQRIRFGLPRAGAARLEVFDAGGRRVATLLDGATLPAGFHSVLWRPDLDGPRAASGVYFHRLTVGGEIRTVRTVLVR